jgi:hypothetical protein
MYGSGRRRRAPHDIDLTFNASAPGRSFRLLRHRTRTAAASSSSCSDVREVVGVTVSARFCSLSYKILQAVVLLTVGIGAYMLARSVDKIVPQVFGSKG